VGVGGEEGEGEDGGGEEGGEEGGAEGDKGWDDLSPRISGADVHHCAAYIGIGGMKIEDEPRH
jgi:hypothetical protein